MTFHLLLRWMFARLLASEKLFPFFPFVRALSLSPFSHRFESCTTEKLKPSQVEFYKERYICELLYDFKPNCWEIFGYGKVFNLETLSDKDKLRMYQTLLKCVPKVLSIYHQVLTTNKTCSNINQRGLEQVTVFQLNRAS